ncbi:MAG: DUF1501 domain-containing protein, partial [Pyrinomonadaceae bacterium]
GDSNTALASVLPLNNPVTSDGSTYSSAQNTGRRNAFDAIRALVTTDRLPKAAADTTTSALQTSAALASANPVIATAFPNTSIGRQLLQIARLIALRDTLSMKRQIFFASVGSFDTHSNQTAAGSQATLLQQVSQAVSAFYSATVELGVQNNVTTFTQSDFGRTLQPAGSGAAVGSDHAWGNHHFVVGGAVRGGDFYGAYPTLVMGGPDDTDSGSNPRGRWIPTTSVEQYAATLATWYGLSASDLPLVFPFIGRFASANLGFMF